MSHHRARLCPWCRALNGLDSERCVRCARRLPGPIAGAALDLAARARLLGNPCTVLFAVVNAAAFVALHAPPDEAARVLGGASGSRLVAFGAIASPLTDGEPWRLVSAGFLHAGILHVGLNLLGLVQTGRDAERIVGPARFAVAYVVSGALGFLASIGWARLASPGQLLLTVGASASIFGVLGVLLGWLVGRRDPRWRDFGIRTVLYALVFAFAIPRVNHAAHFGGLAAGAAFGFAFARERRPERRARAMAALAAACVAIVFVSLGLARRSPVSRAILDAERERMERVDP